MFALSQLAETSKGFTWHFVSGGMWMVSESTQIHMVFDISVKRKKLNEIPQRPCRRMKS